MPKCGNGENFDATRTLRIKNAPPQLPSRRPRSLTLPLTQLGPTQHKVSRNPFKKSTIEQQRTHDQQQSSLFLKLPHEIRKQIWAEVVGYKWVHIVRAPKRLLGIECREGGKHQNCRCWGLTTSRISLGEIPGFFLEPRKDSKSKMLDSLALLKTCRKVYSEAIDLLYSTNTFHVNHLDTLLYLSTTTLPSRLNSVRALVIDWHIRYPMYPIIETAKPSPGYGPPYDEATWQEVWRLIAHGMKGLRELHVYLSGLGVAPKQYGKLLEPLLEVREVPVFNVVLPKWPNFPRSAEIVVPNASFQIIEEEEDG